MPSDLMSSEPETGAFPSHSVCRPQQRKRGKGENKWNVIVRASRPGSRFSKVLETFWAYKAMF